VIRLKHAGADKLLQILKDIFVNKKNVSTIKNSNAEHDEDQEINIVSDPATNSLIITASKDRFPEIIETVNKLDIYRKQVLVEALIAEVSLSDMKEIGMELGIADNSPNSDNAVASTNFGLKQNLSSSGGLNAGLVKGSLDVEKAGAGNLNELSKIKAIIKAYQNNSKFKILSTPTILASDNEASSIIVGQVVALPEGFARDTETGRFDLTKFKYADVGINLNIIPRVSPDKKVTLQVDVNAQERLEENLYDFNIPVLTKRAAKTTITISDRETVVIGGLIREDKQKLTKKIPLLGDLPLIGKFFRSRKTVKNKTNLLIFITPHIVDQSEDMRIISQKMESRSEIAEDAAEFTSQLKKRSELKLSDK
jgi:general secretion pathway protein D